MVDRKQRMSEVMRRGIDEGVRETTSFIANKVEVYSRQNQIKEPMLRSALATAIKHSLAMHAAVACAMASSMTLEELEREIVYDD